ncbi:ligand of Numb protein X 2-like [Bacillus rossius redtenbacheri]|uniref:ligand of Numb protein X 2-like n=1 Tax=Bacillus rossius redtenbacheri TaxID=93214 RepID=UPI002FDE113B
MAVFSCDLLLEVNGRAPASRRHAASLLGDGADRVQLRLRRPQRLSAAPAAAADMGSNVSRHHSAGKGLSGRRTQSSGNLCNGHKVLVAAACVAGERGKKLCGSLPNHLDNNNDEFPPPAAAGEALELRLHPLPDQGYASERSPDEERPPPPPPPLLLPDYPFITAETTFEVRVEKGSRGLGLSVAGGADSGGQWPGLIRIKRLFPHQPAWQTGRLSQGDVLLAANGVRLSGLSNCQALEVLRRTPSSVVLVVCRPPADVFSPPPPSEPPPPPRRDPAHSITTASSLAVPPLQPEGPSGEFDIFLTKVNHSLGFTLRKEDESVLGHYVRALVREPALSDGRIRPGDKIVAVNDVDISPMSHEEAVMFLRQCGDHVKLRLYRDASQTPVSALSPTEECKLFRPKPILRKEAMDMLSDLAVRKLSPGDSNSSSCSRLRRLSDGHSSSSPCSSPRRRRLTKTPSPETQPLTQDKVAQKYAVPGNVGNSDSSGESSNTTTDTCTYRSSFDSTAARGHGSSFASSVGGSEDGGGPDQRPQRPNFLDLCGAAGAGLAPGAARRPQFALPTAGDDGWGGDAYAGGNPPSEPASMPPLTDLSSTSSTSTAFSYRNPAYQSACPAPRGKTSEDLLLPGRSSDQDIPAKVFGSCPDGSDGTRGLLKWKGVVFTPEDDGAGEEPRKSDAGESTREQIRERPQEGQVLMVELTRGWNSRLGFSLREDGACTVISAVYADSVAAKDGRLRAGDQVIMVNDEDVTNMSTADVIDLLRKMRGTIGITVLRKQRPCTQTS